MRIFIGLDDTDTIESPSGTGHLARQIMMELAQSEVLSYGVSRHQLLFDERIPYTAKNSANVVHILGDKKDLSRLAERAERIIKECYQPGSDPGLCIAAEIPDAIVEFGHRAKQEIVTQEEAQELALQHGIFLKGLGGDNGGIIGALAGVGLAAYGNDGRFTLVGRSRDLLGVVPVSEILNVGIAEVRSLDDEIVSEGQVQTENKIRPSLREGRAVLYVERENGFWRALRLD